MNTAAKHEKSKPEINSGEILVETSGYIPKSVRVKTLIKAGERLAMLRKEQFDYVGNELEPNIDVDPTRAKNFDLVDAQRILENGMAANVS